MPSLGPLLWARSSLLPWAQWEVWEGLSQPELLDTSLAVICTQGERRGCSGWGRGMNCLREDRNGSKGESAHLCDQPA